MSYRSIHTKAAWLCLETHLYSHLCLIQIHPTTTGTTARFLCPVHQSKPFCCLSPVCSRQMEYSDIAVFLRGPLQSCLSKARAWLAQSLGSPGSPLGAPISRAACPALALGVNQAKHTQFIKPTLNSFRNNGKEA